MNNTTTQRLQTIIFAYMLLCTSSQLYGREADGFLARPIAWVADCLKQFKSPLSLYRNTIPAHRLGFQASQVNAALSSQLTQEQRRILIKNLIRFKALALNAQNSPEAQKIICSIILPEQPGTCQQPLKGVTLFAQQFTDQEDKEFLTSDLGKQSLRQLLMHAPHPMQTVSRTQLIHNQEKLGAPLVDSLQQWQQILERTQQILKEQQTNPQVMQALEALENDTHLRACQEKTTELEKLLEQKANDPELQKVLPTIQKKDNELEAQLMRMLQKPGLTPEQKEKLAQEMLAEYEAFIKPYPAAVEYIALMKQLLAVTEETQKRVQQVSKEHPTLAPFVQLMQTEHQAVEKYNACVRKLQALPQVVKQMAQQHNTKIWCKNVDQWFAACIQALKENSQPEEHLLFYEQEMNDRVAEWRAVVQGWKDLEAYKAYRKLNRENERTYSDEYLESQYARLDKTVDDVKDEKTKEVRKEIAKILNIPEDTKKSLETLGITDLDPKILEAEIKKANENRDWYLSLSEELKANLEECGVSASGATDALEEHKKRIKKAFFAQSRKTHPDKTDNKKTADQASLNEAKAQLDRLIDNDFSDVTPEQLASKKAFEKKLHEIQQHGNLYLRAEHMEAQHNIDVVERPIEWEEMLERAVRNNAAFNRMHPYALQKAQQTPLTILQKRLLQPMDLINFTDASNISYKDHT